MPTNKSKEQLDNIRARMRRDFERLKNMPPMQMQVPSRLPGPFWAKANTFQFIYSLCGLLVGFVCIIGGIVLFFRGVTGASSWTAKILGAESTISDAAPGVVLFIVGIFMVLLTRFDVKVEYPPELQDYLKSRTAERKTTKRKLPP